MLVNACLTLTKLTCTGKLTVHVDVRHFTLLMIYFNFFPMFFFFPKFEFPNSGWGLSANVAYMPLFMVHD